MHQSLVVSELFIYWVGFCTGHVYETKSLAFDHPFVSLKILFYTFLHHKIHDTFTVFRGLFFRRVLWCFDQNGCSARKKCRCCKLSCQYRRVGLKVMDSHGGSEKYETCLGSYQFWDKINSWDMISLPSGVIKHGRRLKNPPISIGTDDVLSKLNLHGWFGGKKTSHFYACSYRTYLPSGKLT